jgi:hypothetical protein
MARQIGADILGALSESVRDDPLGNFGRDRNPREIFWIVVLSLCDDNVHATCGVEIRDAF